MNYLHVTVDVLVSLVLILPKEKLTELLPQSEQNLVPGQHLRRQKMFGAFPSDASDLRC